MKKCSNCKVEKTLENFHSSSIYPDGKKYTCKDCRSVEAKKYSEVSKKNKAKNWYRSLFFDCRKRAKKAGYELDFDINYILELYNNQNKKCYWYGIEMIPSSKAKYPFQPSVDRIDNTKGYSKDNIILCCFSANMGRNANNFETFKEFADVIRGLKNQPKIQNINFIDKREKFVTGPNGLYFNTTKEAADYLKLNVKNFNRFLKNNPEWKVHKKTETSHVS